MKNRITIRIPDELYEKIIEEKNMSEFIRKIIEESSQISNGQMNKLIEAFDKIWDELSISAQNRLIKDKLIIDTGEILNAFRGSE